MTSTIRRLPRASFAPHLGVRAAAIAALGAPLLFASPAHASCRARTVKVLETSSSCSDQGVPLFWRNSCVGYALNREGSKKVSFNDAGEVIVRAFAAWTGALCPGVEAPPSIRPKSQGAAACASAVHNADGPNQNVILLRDEWPHDQALVALTTTTFNEETGELYDADIEINMTVPIALQGGADSFDLATVVTHEVGHFLGLSHSQVQSSVMSRQPVLGQVKHELDDDDVAAICGVYRPDGTRSVLDGKAFRAAACDATPRGGIARECKGTPADEEEEGGCSNVPVGSPPVGAACLVLFGLVLVRRARSLATH